MRDTESNVETSESKLNVEESNASRAPKSKTKSKNTTRTSQIITGKTIPQIDNYDNAIIEKYLKSKPIVEISWNERQLGEISLKQCEVALNSIGAADYQTTSKHFSPNTSTIIWYWIG